MTSPSPSWPNFLSLCDCFLDTAAIGSMWWPRQILLNDSTNRASVGASGTLSHKWSNRHLRSLSRYPTSFCFLLNFILLPPVMNPWATLKDPCPSSLHTSFKSSRSCQTSSHSTVGDSRDRHLFGAPSTQEESTQPAEMPMWIFYIRAVSTWGEPTWWVSLHSFQTKKKERKKHQMVFALRS